MLFETDFPHPTCLYPDPLTWVDDALAGLDDDTKRRVLQDNAAALYKVPLPAHRVTVDGAATLVPSPLTPIGSGLDRVRTSRGAAA